jgi:hypothetical protein
MSQKFCHTRYTENIRKKGETFLKTTFYTVFYAEKDGDNLGKKFHEKNRFFVSRVSDLGLFLGV